MLSTLRVLQEQAEGPLPLWKRMGWSRDAANGREAKILRAGGEQPGIVKPCRFCGGRKFSLAHLKIKDKEKLVRSCDRCRKNRQKRANRKYNSNRKNKDRINKRVRDSVQAKMARCAWIEANHDKYLATAKRYRMKKRDEINAKARAKRAERRANAGAGIAASVCGVND